MKKHSGYLYKVDDEDLVLLDQPKLFFDNVNTIGVKSFYESAVRVIDLPDHVFHIDESAFANSKLEKITLPLSVFKIGLKAFENTKLKSIVIPSSVGMLSDACFRNCHELKEVIIDGNPVVIPIEAFSGCEKLEKVILKEGMRKVSHRAFYNCTSLKRIVFPKSFLTVGPSAFENCTSLERVYFTSGTINIDFCAFLGCDNLKSIEIPYGELDIRDEAMPDFKYIIIKKEGFLLTNEEVNNTKWFKMDVRILKRTFFDRNTCVLIRQLANNPEIIGGLKKLYPYMEKYNFRLPITFLSRLIDFDKIDDFIKDLNVKNLNNLSNNIIGIRDGFEINLKTLYDFAYVIGCFSGNPKLAKRATDWLIERINPHAKNKIADIDIKDIHTEYFMWKVSEVNEEFSEFLMSYDSEYKTPTFTRIINLPEYGMLMDKIYREYCDKEDDLVNGRFRDKSGNLKFRVLRNKKVKELVPTLDLFREYFTIKTYPNINNEEELGVAKEFSNWHGLTNENYYDAIYTLQEFNKQHIPTSLLGVHLKEEIIQYTKSSKESFDKGLELTRDILVELNNNIENNFTYDWLEKNDPLNFCLGLYCNCCANIDGYGRSIVRASILSPSVQTLTIRNKKGTIISKSTLYINKKQGYGVFNTIEISQTVKEEDYESIVKAYKRGINKFVEIYNDNNPHNNINKISVGIERNDLLDTLKKNGYIKKCNLKGMDFSAWSSGDSPGEWMEGQLLIYDNTGGDKNENTIKGIKRNK